MLKIEGTQSKSLLRRCNNGDSHHFPQLSLTFQTFLNREVLSCSIDIP
jgi:hypothetical protein